MKKFVKENPAFVSFFLVILLFGITSFAEVMRCYKQINFFIGLTNKKNTEINNLEDSIYNLNRQVWIYKQDHEVVESLKSQIKPWGLGLRAFLAVQYNKLIFFYSV
jgi:hypothetical protein